MFPDGLQIDPSKVAEIESILLERTLKLEEIEIEYQKLQIRHQAQSEQLKEKLDELEYAEELYDELNEKVSDLTQENTILKVNLKKQQEIALRLNEEKLAMAMKNFDSTSRSSRKGFGNRLSIAGFSSSNVN